MENQLEQKTKQVFLRLMREHLNGSPSEIDEEIDWQLLYEIAQAQQMTSVVFSQIKENAKDARFGSTFAQVIFAYGKRVNAERKLKIAFDAAGFRYVMVKGLTIAAKYPIPALRSMGDTDIVIHPDDMKAAHDTLVELGFTAFDQTNPEHRDYAYGQIFFEMHNTMVETTDDEQGAPFFNNWEPYWKNGELDWNFHFLYLLSHLRKHMIAAGVGFRQYMDIAVITQKVELDWDWIVKKAKELQLDRFLFKVMAFNERAFDVKSPIPVEPMSDAFFADAVEIIFKNGVFGFQNRENDDMLLVGHMLRNQESYRKMKIRYLFRSIFPEYEKMKQLPFCSYLKSPLLLPIAWIHRIFRRLFRSKEKIVVLENIKVDEVSANNRLNMLRSWGL